MMIYPPIQGLNTDEPSKPTPWPYHSHLEPALRGWFFFPTSQSVHGFIRWILSSPPLPLFLTKLATITRVRSIVSLFLPHDHTRHYNAHVRTPPHLSVSLGLWLSSALVVTYYCFIVSRFPVLLLSLVLCFSSSILGDYTRVWFRLCPFFLNCSPFLVPVF